MLLIATKIAMLNLRAIPEMICPAYKSSESGGVCIVSLYLRLNFETFCVVLEVDKPESVTDLVEDEPKSVPDPEVEGP